MTITYEFEDSLYVNMTNRCSNACSFCVRSKHDSINGTDYMWLDREPTLDEIKADFEKRDLSAYRSVVFCGYGEPLMRFDDCMAIAKWIKEKMPEMPIRINTNGQASLIAGRDVTPEMEGLIDCVSISLNAANAKRYDELCHSEYGEAAFDALLDFAVRAKKYVPKVVLSVVNHDITAEELDECRRIASDRGVTLRIRDYIK